MLDNFFEVFCLVCCNFFIFCFGGEGGGNVFFFKIFWLFIFCGFCDVGLSLGEVCWLFFFEEEVIFVLVLVKVRVIDGYW